LAQAAQDDETDWVCHGANRIRAEVAKTYATSHDPAVMSHIRRAYEMYATAKYSYEQIAPDLFRQGIATKYGKLLSPKRVVDFLSDSFYYGCFLWHGEIHQSVHEPAVSKAPWDKVQQVGV
jgi:hypothetical protein